ncbi:hypothetical protein BHM03_00030222 [Ensete ventricosum]|nr:hypothetical protein BHM03_00030222 [Ensete ventricosum]
MPAPLSDSFPYISISVSPKRLPVAMSPLPHAALTVRDATSTTHRGDHHIVGDHRILCSTASHDNLTYRWPTHEWRAYRRRLYRCPTGKRSPIDVAPARRWPGTSIAFVGKRLLHSLARISPLRR